MLGILKHFLDGPSYETTLAICNCSVATLPLQCFPVTHVSELSSWDLVAEDRSVLARCSIFFVFIFQFSKPWHPGQQILSNRDASAYCMRHD